ncbi:Hypothetical_protein [Hexamita inflata]|uniref:Hypothetical_protein n=1 Tax=Hexamita inflata TaxID=28002 RepID=A0AA86P8U1_9EUKA|nr:Hypothetical protein HINF_LOCUS20681 [Hexamita inflata]
MSGCFKCPKNKYFWVLTWFCVMFISMMVAGITLCCIQTTYGFPIYSEDKQGKLDHYMHNDFITLYMGSGLTLAIVGFFGFIITCCFSCILGKSGEVTFEQVRNLTMQPQQYPIPQFQADQNQM